MSAYQVKKDSSLPPWLEENKTVIGVGLAAVLLVGTMLWRDFMPAPPPPPEPMLPAALAVVMGPVKTWEEGSTARLRSVQLKVMNRGPGVAHGVVVVGVVRGMQLYFSGKDTLAVREVGDYTLTFNTVVLNSDALEFKTECHSCPR